MTAGYVKIIKSPGSSEPLVTQHFFSCAAVVKASGQTIEDCHLKVIKSLGFYSPGLFCRQGLQNESFAAEQIGHLAGRLEVAIERWWKLQSI